jgi:resuscitation-promoting factor RpfB
MLSACQPSAPVVTILADGKTISLRTTERVPSKLLEQAGIQVGEHDRLVYQGKSVAAEEQLPQADVIELILRRALTLVVHSPSGEKRFDSSAFSIGEALAEAGYSLQEADRVEPPANTPLDATVSGRTMGVTYIPAQELTIAVEGKTVTVYSAAATVGDALAEAGLPLIGLDTSMPPDSEALPEDGRIRVTRVTEAVALIQSSIPYGTRTELSADLELDQQALLQGGELGLKIARMRTRNEDGAQTEQSTEGETIVRPPVDRVLGIGTKVVIKTATVDGVEIQYWRAITLYATPYHPCDAAGTCYYGTSMGTRVRRGEAALVYPWYLLLAGERVYVPGYGYATIEDNNGANTSAYWGTRWIDLGYAQEDTIDWVNHYVTVYFLAPIPANIANLYILP